MGSDSFEKPPRPASPTKRRAGEMENGIQHNKEIAETQPTQEDDFVASSIEQPSPADTSVTSVEADSPAVSAQEDEASAASQGIPSIDDQVAQVQQMVSRPLEEGDRGVVVPVKWLQRVVSRTTEKLHDPEYPKVAREGEVGKFDTSSIVPEDAFTEPVLHDMNNVAFIPLKPDVSMGNDIEIVPHQAYGLIVGWYGATIGQKAIIRYAHNTADDDAASTNMVYELNPPIFTIRTLTLPKQAEEDKPRNSAMALRLKQTRKSLGQMSTDDAVQLVSSRVERFQKFLARAKEHVGIPINTKVKVYKVTPPNQPGRAKLVVDKDELKSLEDQQQLEEVEVSDETANDKYNGKSTMPVYQLHNNATLILVEQSSTRKPVAVRKAASVRQSSPAAGIVTRGRAARSGRTRGIVGLNNLGNTCYMNSALQCIRSVEELSAYFLVGRYKQEINVDNPLGHKGAMATKYDGVLKGIYNDNSSGSYSPSPFKSTLSRCMPTFSGWGQQDSQEFLSFLVDALHEDLNRIEKKPYLESPDSEDDKVKDPEYITALGEVYRKNYRARNDSVIMDLFSGFYKNTMECPVCDKISVTFDPYSLLTLQLPVSNTITHSFIFAPLQGKLVVHELDMEKSFSVRDLKQYIASKHEGVDATKLWMIEVYAHKIYKVFDDTTTMGEASIQPNDHIYLYELELAPTYPPTLNKGYGSKREPVPSMDSDKADVLTVPILHRKDRTSTTLTATLHPQYISLTREEAKDLDVIKKKVLQCAAQLTSRDILAEELVQESTGEPHVSDHSGEDDYVKVSLEKPDAVADDSAKMLYKLSFAKSSEGGHCASMSSFSDHSVRPIESRVKLPSRRSSITSSTTEVSTVQDEESQDGRVESPTATEDPASPAPDTTDDDDVRSHRQRAGKGNKFRSGTKGNKEKRQQKRDKKVQRQAKQNATPTSDQDDEQSYYIQIGECILVDWYPEPYDTMFLGNATNTDDERGHYLGETNDIEKVEDTAVAANRARREHRKKYGITLEDCFIETGKREQLSQDNAWYCGRCKELRQATKTLEIWTLPDILVLHLKRFGGNRRFNDKLDLKVDYPIEGLDLNSKIGLKDGKDYTYDLFAVDLHYGGLGGGHYVADAKSFVDGEWYHYNDSSASKQSGAPSPQAAAYLLFYRRRSDKPLGPESLQEIVYKYRNPAEGDETGEEQLDGHSLMLPGSSSNSAAGITAKTVSQGRIASADGSYGVVGSRQTTSRHQTMSDDHDEGIEMDDDDDKLPAYGPAQPPMYSTAPVGWSFDNLEDKNMADDDNDSTLAEADDHTDAWNETETSFTVGDDQSEDQEEPVHEINLS